MSDEIELTINHDEGKAIISRPTGQTLLGFPILIVDEVDLQTGEKRSDQAPKEIVFYSFPLKCSFHE